MYTVYRSFAARELEWLVNSGAGEITSKQTENHSPWEQQGRDETSTAKFFPLPAPSGVAAGEWQQEWCGHQAPC